MSRTSASVRWLWWLAVAALLGGCSAAAVGPGGVVLGLLAVLALTACTQDPAPTPVEDAEAVTDAGLDATPPDAGRDAAIADAGADGGAWEPCCTDGVIASCYCPAGAACNYGWFTPCGGGECVEGGGACPGADQGVDAEPLDGGAVDQGAVDQGAVDMAPVEADMGFWEACCLDGVIDSCYCPAGAACNYGWFEDCGGGACTVPGGACP